MAAKFEACVECTQRCLLLHEKKKNSLPIITSFFKVIIGSHCLSYLYLPPKFAATVSELIDQEAFLEDSNGQQWKLKISKINGSLGFDLNWNLFSVDHGLKVGDFLAFHYIKGSHFHVRIYDKTGCEKLDFPCRRNQRKRARIDGHYNTKVGPCNSIDKGLMKNYNSIVSKSDVGLNWGQLEVNDIEKVPVPAFGEKFVEEPLYVTDRVLGETKGEDRSSILDLASFEKPKIVDSFGGSHTHKVIMEDRCPDDADVHLRCCSKAFLVGCNLLAEETVSRILPSDASNFENMEQINDTEPMHKIETISDKGSCNYKISRQHLIESANKPNNGGYMSDMLDALTKRCWDAEKREQAQSGLEADIIKGEPIKNNPVAVLKQRHTSLVEDCQVSQLKFAGTSETLVLPITSGIQQCEKEMMSKIELMEMTSELCSRNEIIPEICGQKQMFSENCYPNMILRNNNQFGGISTVEETVSRMLPSDASDFVKIKQINDVGLMHKIEIVSDMSIGLIEGCWNAEKADKAKSDRVGNTGKGEPIENDAVAILQQKHTSLIDDCQIAQVKSAGTLETLELPVTDGIQSCESGQKAGFIEKSNHPNMIVRDNDQFDGVGTVEAVDTISTTPIAANISCSVGGDNQSFLELPTYLPICLPPSSSKRTRIESKVVLLRDPNMRPWPVLYHERPRFGILCSGWEAFSKANDIQVGDECVFCAECESEGMYRVNIIRNQKAHGSSSLIL